MSQVRVFLALLALVVAVHWPRLQLEEWRGTEARRVQIATEMNERGDWLVPTLFGEPTLAKPPFYYWVLMATMRAAGSEPWVLRLPSLLGLAVLALVAHRALRLGHGASAAWIGAIGIVAAPLIMQDTPVAEIDPLFAALTGCSLVLLARGAAWQEKLSLLGAGLCGGLALVTKGPPYFLFLAGAVLVWARRRSLRGILWFVLPLVLPPLIWMLVLRRAGTHLDDLAAVASEETVLRLFRYQWRHVLDTPAYFLRAAGVLLPLALWTFHEYRGRSTVREAKVSDDELLLRIPAGAAIGAILLLALFPGRPMRYLLPAVALYAFAVAPAVANYAATATVGAFPRAVLRWVGVGAGIVLVAMVTPLVPMPMWPPTILVLLALGLAPGLVTAPRHVVALVLGVPLLAGPTLMTGIAAWQSSGLKASTPVAAIFRRELEAAGVREVGTRGHFPAAVLRGLGVRVEGDEFASRPPRHDWLLVEDSDDEVQIDASVVPGYRDRMRVRVIDKSLVLLERERG